jgi:quercetin dioxygenase-like cupin family protein
MKANNGNTSINNPREIQTIRPAFERITAKRKLAPYGILLLALGLLSANIATAFDFVPFGEGTLPNGKIVSMFQVTFAPGESFPWHFHPGPIWGVIISGTLTEDEGCGTALKVYSAGDAFSETPGRVHRVFNYGTEPVVINFAGVFPPCYANYNSSLFVDGPRCEGTSGRSHLEKIPPCGVTGASGTSKTKPVAAVPSLQPVSGTRTQEQSVTTQKTAEQRAVSDSKKTTLSALVEAAGEKS